MLELWQRVWGRKVLWAVGLLASGQVATIGLTYAGQLVMASPLSNPLSPPPLLPLVSYVVVEQGREGGRGGERGEEAGGGCCCTT